MKQNLCEPAPPFALPSRMASAPRARLLTEATAFGIAERTLRRARKALGVQVRREGFDRDGSFLALPSNGPDTW